MGNSDELSSKPNEVIYRQLSNIRHIYSQNLNVSRLVLQLFLRCQVLSLEWGCSWSSADRLLQIQLSGKTIWLPIKVRLILYIWR